MKNKEEIKKIMETIDVLKILLMEGERERGIFGKGMFYWGIINGFIFLYYYLKSNIFGELFWFYLLYIGFFVSTVEAMGLLRGILYWGSSLIILMLLFNLTKNWLLFITLLLVSAFFGYYYAVILHSKKRGKERAALFKLPLGNKIAIFWLVMMCGVGLLVGVFEAKLGASLVNFDYNFLFVVLLGFGISVGLFVSGLIDKGFLIIGVISTFGIPVLSLINVNLGYVMASGVSFISSIYGGYLYLKSGKGRSYP
ncbi:MAG: hypothetical protein J7J33_06140 [Caldisericia bacterium]|nr:hypothetical protein [Caldisericia bacterium]